MKKFFSKIKDLILRHKLLSAICFLAAIVIIIMFYVFFSLFVGVSNKYGDRLNGISSYQVSTSDKEKITSFLEEKEEVNKASVRVQGKIIYIHIEYKKNATEAKAKEIATASLDKISKKNQEFYDIGYFLTTESKEGEENYFVTTGSKNNESKGISWIKS